MPKAAPYRLRWDPKQGTYTLHDTDSQRALWVAPDSHAWFYGLASIPSFTFSGQHGQLTLRQESRSGGRYWYAYRRVGEKMAKRYLGRTPELTPARLEQVAAQFAADALSLGQSIPTREVSRAERASQHLMTSPIASLPSGMSARSAVPPLPESLHDVRLVTKLHIPRLRTQLVRRTHLIQQLQQGGERALMLVSAPAGFGKTTLLAQWLEESGRPAAWLSLEAQDNDSTRFLSYLVAALQTLDAQIGTMALAMLHTPQPPPPETVLAVLTNDLVDRREGDFVLVLDDYHLITADPIHRGMTFLLEHLPPQLHLILATRADPPLPLAQLRAQGQLFEVRAADLRFGAAEASAFLQVVMGLDLEASAIATLEHRTEGWIAGLQLAALSLQGRADIAGFLAAFTGSHRYVLDYLSNEVLARQPAAVQTFLLHTCILERLSEPLCNAVTGQEGSQAMLEALERANLFVVALDDERGWYRYHHLFAEMLRRHLQQREPALVPQLHRRASAWYEQHNLPAEAVQHALAAPDVELAARLIEPIAFPVAFHGQVSTALGWLHALPEAFIRSRPFLCICSAALLTVTNQWEAAEARLQEAERGVQQGMPAEQAQIIQGYVLTIRGRIAIYSGDISCAVFHARKALELLPEAEVIIRMAALVTIIHAYQASGEVTLAIEREAARTVALVRASDNLFQTVESIALMAQLYVLQGRLQRAAATYAQVEQAIPQAEMLPTVFTNLFYYFGLGDLQREWNDLEAAEQHLRQGMALINETRTIGLSAAMLGYTALARLEQARGNTREALATLDALAHLAERRRFAPHLVTRGAAVRAQLELAQGNTAAAIRWAEASGLSTTDDNLPYSREGEYLALIRVRIAEAREDPMGSFLQDTLHLLERLRRDAEAKARLGSVLEILIVRALALEAQGDRARALSTLEQALVLAEPEGYIRLFVDEGAPMQALLRPARVRSAVPGYVTTLLSAFGEQHASDLPLVSTHPSALVEPLTEREREVLQLLLAGASNREIARRLVLSVGTVKKHVYNICGKLGVQSRTQAIARSRALHLL